MIYAFNILFPTLLFPQAVSKFLSEVNGENGKQHGDKVDKDTAIKFLMARKFDVKRSIELYKAYLVCLYQIFQHFTM